MPTYEYRCKKCKHHFELFQSYAEYGQMAVTCPKCGSDNVQRLIGKVRIARTEERRIEEMVDPSQLNGIEDDPKALGRLMRRMGAESGEQIEPEFEEMISQLENGQNLEQIEKDMPGLDNAPDGGG